MFLENGSLLGDRYRILELIRKGGMGAVYRATDLRLGNTVAVKQNLLGPGSGNAGRPGPAGDPLHGQFESEAKILASLRHPGLPRVIDYFTIQGEGQYLVMEFIDGEDLDKPLQRKLLYDEREAVQILIQVSRIVEYLHSRRPHPVIHRDIKPGNIRRSADGFRLVDFGIAKLSTGEKTVFKAHTPGYAPPEQHSFSARTDERSDVYALGATLFGLLTGGPPTTATARKVDGSMEALAVRLPRAAPELREVIRRAMKLKPDERYQSVTDFKNALKEQAGRYDRKPDPDARTVVRKPPSRLAPVLLGVACLGGLLWLNGDDPGPPRLEPVVIRSLSVSSDGADLAWTPAATPGFSAYEVHFSPDRDFRPSIGTRSGLPLTVATETSRSVTGLKCETHYFFRIRVVDRGGRHADSDFVEAVTGPCRKPVPEAAPPPVTADTTISEASGPDATGTKAATPDPPPRAAVPRPRLEIRTVRATSPTSVELAWEATGFTDVSAFEVHASRAPAFNPSPQTLKLAISGVGRTSATVTGLECDTPYTFRLRARMDGGKTLDSRALAGRTAACGP